ncbi:MAG: hypothetical protein ACR2HM_02800 [Acidimicrobiales bacterium]
MSTRQAVVSQPALPTPPVVAATSLRRHVGWALAGTALAFVLLLLDIRASGNGILRPIRAGARGPGAAVVASDFPTVNAPDQVGLDGQQFYAVARDPFHPDTVAANLDRPQYRYGRPLYPMLAWLLHPSGGGPGLVWAFVIVSLAGLFVGGLAMGVLSSLVRGPPWAVLFPLLPAGGGPVGAPVGHRHPAGVPIGLQRRRAGQRLRRNPVDVDAPRGQPGRHDERDQAAGAALPFR